MIIDAKKPFLGQSFNKVNRCLKRKMRRRRFKGFLDVRTFKVVERPTQVLSSKLVYKKKTGKVTRYNARFVVKGCADHKPTIANVSDLVRKVVVLIVNVLPTRVRIAWLNVASVEMLVKIMFITECVALWGAFFHFARHHRPKQFRFRCVFGMLRCLVVFGAMVSLLDERMSSRAYHGSACSLRRGRRTFSYNFLRHVRESIGDSIDVIVFNSNSSEL